jgi:hypothetical protein
VVDLLSALDDEESLVPLVEALAPAVEPDTGVLVHALNFTHRAALIDEREVLAEVLAATVRPTTANHETIALDVLVDVFKQTNRVAPGSDEIVDAGDFNRILNTLRTFLQDDTHGIERLYAIIENR